MSASIPDRMPARFLDSMNHTMTNVWVAQIHLAMDFDAALDRERLTHALRLLLDAEPVLGCRYIPRWFRPFWSRIPASVLDRHRILFESMDETAFLQEDMGGQDGPQIRAAFSDSDGERLILKVSHQVGDAGGVKDIAARLAEIYRELGKNAAYRPEPNLGSRSLGQLYGRFSLRKKLSLLAYAVQEQRANSRPIRSLQYPSGRRCEGPPRFTIQRFGKERIREFRSFCQPHDATLNDLFVAAVLRAIVRQTNWDGDGALRLLGTVDNRRYLPGKQAESICNLSSFMFPDIGFDPGGSLEQTLRAIKQSIDAQKNEFFGLAYLYLARISLLPYPYIVKRWMTRGIFKLFQRIGNIPPSLTNMGPIDAERLDFDGMRPERAELIVPASIPPFFILGMSGYRDGISLSLGSRDSAVPPSKVEELFRFIDQELPK